MKIVTGPFAEARGYLQYVLALLHPGTDVPVFHGPRDRRTNLEHLQDEDYTLIIEEGRRQLDRQAAEMQRNHTRAATLLTVTVAEIVFLVSSRAAVFDHSLLVTVPWFVGVALAVLALAGTISVLTSKAVYGYVDTVDLADGSTPVLPRLARAYADAAPIGDVTNAARLTVLRDAVWLAALTAVCLVMITPFSAASTQPRRHPAPVQTPTIPSPPPVATPTEGDPTRPAR
jgi:hypothetical protein